MCVNAFTRRSRVKRAFLQQTLLCETAVMSFRLREQLHGTGRLVRDDGTVVLGEVEYWVRIEQETGHGVAGLLRASGRIRLPSDPTASIADVLGVPLVLYLEEANGSLWNCLLKSTDGTLVNRKPGFTWADGRSHTYPQ